MPVDFLSLYQETIGYQPQQILGYIWQVIRNWWWLFLPFFIVGDDSSPPTFLFFWRRWRKDVWYANVFDPVVYELKIPREIKKPIRAMEKVIIDIHTCVYHPPDWWEKWIEGQDQTSVSFEVASVEGSIHFYIRLHSAYTDGVKAAFYAEYPDIEFEKVNDYTREVPQDIPNEEWDMWGTNYFLIKPDAYPILTYKDFETEREAEEEKRVDPVSSLLEAMSLVSEGEQLWIQIVGTPMGQEGYDAWKEEAVKVRDRVANRLSDDKPIKRRPIPLEAMDLLLWGKMPEEIKVEEEEGFLPPELKLTPGEREILAAIERKLSKPVFNSYARFILLGKRGLWSKAKLRLAFTYFGSYKTEHINSLHPYSPTLTKIKKKWFLPINWVRPRRMHLRQRRLFRLYRDRLPPHYPKSAGKGAYMLSVEEVASLYHFTSWEIAPVPGVSRVEAKKKPPPELPT
ncbi:MAG: hypothetical protein GF370_02145 [Candidatus Nealsonbacteria bacterium]|nr:hypothetical protein [Candidatus Nealsonbacteria bacterium]